MTALKTQMNRVVLGAFFLVFSTFAALANCPARDDVTPAMLAEFGTINAAQRALRTALGETRTGLTDGFLGERTQTAVVDLCNLVPQPANADLTRATLDVMQTYLALDIALAGWQGRPFDRDLTADADGDAPVTIGLSLAATPTLRARALRNQPTQYQCVNIVADLAGNPDAMYAIETITEIYGGNFIAPEICLSVSAPDDTQVMIDGFARLGRLNRARPDALTILMDIDFLRWVDDERPNRLRRLLATPSAIATLLDEYVATRTIPGATAYTGGGCTPSRTEKTGHFYMLSEDDIANIKTLISLTPVLEGFAEDNPAFDSAGALWRDLEPVLEAELGPCILTDIEPLVTGPRSLPQTYQLANGAAARLAALDPLIPSAAVLEAFQTRSFPTKPAFMAALGAALQTANAEQMNEQVAQIAQTMAAAAEPIAPILDQPSVDIPPEDILLTPSAAPQLRVTEAADDAVQSLVDNTALTDVLARATIVPAPNTEQIESQVRQQLADEVATQIATSVAQQMALIEPSVVQNFGLSQPLANAVTALPYVRAAMTDATGTELPTRLASLADTKFPSQHLFREALASISTEEGQQPFSPFVRERIIAAAAKIAPEPLALRDYSQIAMVDPKCNCTPKLRREDLHVYGFFPFWHAPRPADRLPDDAEPDPLRQIDFGLISDLAFYGLEFTYPQDAQGNGVLQLNNTAHWNDARRDFVNTAHRFRARADLAFDMRDWHLWSETAIETAISQIVREIEPFERLPAVTPREIGRAIPTLFDPVRPDGVTLIFPDYLGTIIPETPDQQGGLTQADMRQMVNIIKGVFESLPDRDSVHINVAFDFPLVGKSLQDPLFDELFQLLVDQPYVLRADLDAPDSGAPAALARIDAKVISKVLLFLERPTSDAKKGLRFRMEQGLFQGKDREDVLRSIIPVLPPNGHRDITQTAKPNPFRAEPPGEFSQFLDDVVYFEDNFAGVGFWPVPDTTSEDLAGLKRIISAEFSPAPWSWPFSGLESALNSACDQICPNRAAIMLSAMGAFVIMLMILRQSFYVGWAYTLGFKLFYAFGMVGAINFAVLVSLAALWLCDPFWAAPKFLFWGLSFMIVMLFIYTRYQQIKNGRKP